MRDAKYRTLVETLRREIQSGRYVAGRRFPSIRALVARFGLTRSTVGHALDELAHAGLVSRIQGRGTFVCPRGVSRRLGLIMPDATQSEYFVRIFRELMRVAECRHYELMFREIKGETAAERATSAERLADDFIACGVSGVVFQPIEYYADGDGFNRRMLARFDAAGIPVVLCDNGLAGSAGGYDVVGINNVSASYALYRHLVEAGSKRICFFMRPNSPASHLGRAQGFVLSKMEKLAGSCGHESLLVVEPDDVKAIRRRIRKDHIDAFLCGDDETAAGLIQTLHKIGCRIPEDVCVAGFNDLNIASYLSPSLTTMRIPCEAIADAAFDRLVVRIENPKLPPSEIFLPVELVVRESTR